ncbi:MAG TPA: LuxR C-terminal-related transcriptional regulator [Sphaerochaeta sp.]|nr:LuxR C-terminal-related transcriptional regulator [Sphaerochaeta sp.]
MNALFLLVHMLAFALGCMTLALAIVYRLAKKQQWITLFIVCHASLLGCMMLLALQALSDLVFTGVAALVIATVISSVLIAAVTFLIVFVPFFTSWVIGRPWRNPLKMLFFILAGAYLALGVCREIFGYILLDYAMVALFVFVLGFCLAVAVKNINSIDNKTARTSTIVILIVSASMVPAILLAPIFPALRPLLLGTYFLALSITVMTFLYMEFTRLSRDLPTRHEKLSFEALSVYHITEREFEVITLISEGLTNKEMATSLGISANTVNNHVANIFAKTKVRSRIDLLNLLKQNW